MLKFMFINVTKAQAKFFEEFNSIQIMNIKNVIIAQGHVKFRRFFLKNSKANFKSSLFHSDKIKGKMSF